MQPKDLEENVDYFLCKGAGGSIMTPQEKIKAYEDAIENILVVKETLEWSMKIYAREVENILAKLDEKLKGV